MPTGELPDRAKRFAILPRLRRESRGTRLFIGHYAVGFASKRLAPRTSLVHLMTAPILGLWNSRAATVAVELPLFLLGLWIYARCTRARGVLGNISLWSFVALMLFAYVADMNASPPPNERALALFGLVQWVVVPWAWWMERTREVRRAGHSLPHAT